MADADAKPVCGLVMPISAIDGCPESHWAEVLKIHSDAISTAGFKPNLVSASEYVGIIQKRIIQNLYDNPVVVVDASAKNANVMFELGLRLAFDKPTIIVKDDKTEYAFDTAPIEHLTYPRDLRFGAIVDFKENLAAKIRATHIAATSDPDYTTFLKHFGEFTVVKLDKREVQPQEFILDELNALRASVQQLERQVAGWHSSLVKVTAGIGAQREKQWLELQARAAAVDEKIAFHTAAKEALESEAESLGISIFEVTPEKKTKWIEHKDLIPTLIRQRSMLQTQLREVAREVPGGK